MERSPWCCCCRRACAFETSIWDSIGGSLAISGSTLVRRSKLSGPCVCAKPSPCRIKLSGPRVLSSLRFCICRNISCCLRINPMLSIGPPIWPPLNSSRLLNALKKSSAPGGVCLDHTPQDAKKLALSVVHTRFPAYSAEA